MCKHGMVTKPFRIPVMGNQKMVGLSKFCVISFICFYLSKQFCTITVNFMEQVSTEIQTGQPWQSAAAFGNLAKKMLL